MTTLPLERPPHGGDHGHGHDAHEHPPYLKHHWDTPVQQFEAGKLGMWLFLATEVLLFGGLFCAYAVWRGGHPELFKYGSQFLNTTLGATNTAVLILSSLTMAWGVTAAQQNKQGLLKLMLVLTLAGAATFLVIKYFEYTAKFEHGLYPGLPFYSALEHAEATSDPDPSHGGAASPNMSSGPAADPHDAAVPPATSPTHAPASAAGTAATAPAAGVPAPGAPSDLPPTDAPTIAPAATGPPGLAPHAVLEAEPISIIHPRHELHEKNLNDPNRPSNAHMFFNIYFMMTGLHGIHVLIGMIVISWLLIRTFQGHFSSEYFTPVDLGGLYWHIVDLIWIFLFPLFYLI
ncbi:MAG: cytochrome c oxidase subunit 3 [Phycisphaerales bacterium]|nr:cytochrome c oxidase subunit 3 [Phycisphaerales bacterium]